MKLYNDSVREYTLKNAKGEIVKLMPKGTVEVTEEVGKKLLSVRAYRGLRDLAELTGEGEKKGKKAPKVEAPADLDKVE